jgi:chromosomal replication initiator protein
MKVKSENKVKLIKGVVAEFYDVSVKDLESKFKRGIIPYARGVASYILYQEGYSLHDIGKKFNRDHSTIIHIINIVTRERKRDINTIKKILHKHLNSTNYEYNTIG